jgi:hypothetical protein
MPSQDEEGDNEVSKSDSRLKLLLRLIGLIETLSL